MFKRKPKQKVYDKQNQIPVIRSSICNGEQVAGFKDLRTGKFSEVMVIRNPKELREFLREYDISADKLKKEW